MAHLPNSGRLGELLVPGYRAYLAAAGQRARAEVPFPWPPPGGAGAEARRTPYDLVLVEVGGLLVSCDARLPPLLLAEALALGHLPHALGLAGSIPVLREPALGDGRADLTLAGPGGEVIVETKSITLVEAGVGLFPDAPTERGTHHARKLAGRVAAGKGRAALAFVVQRPDAQAVSPHDRADPAFGQALREAADAGVEVLAFRCTVTRERIRIAGAIPVRL